MSCLNRFLVSTFIFLVLSSLLVLSTAPVNVQAVNKPSTPQFSVKLVDDSYWVPPTTSTHPYTGETTTISGYLKTQRKLEITVKNQPFTPTTNEKGDKYMLYYTVEIKGHFGDHWGRWGRDIFQSNSDYTILARLPPHYDSAGLVAPGNQLDVRVEAIIGEPSWGSRYVYYEGSSEPYFYRDVMSSGWSDVFTFTMPEFGVTTTLPPTSTQPTNPSDQIPSNPNTPPTSNPPNPYYKTLGQLYSQL